MPLDVVLRFRPRSRPAPGCLAPVRGFREIAGGEGPAKGRLGGCGPAGQQGARAVALGALHRLARARALDRSRVGEQQVVLPAGAGAGEEGLADHSRLANACIKPGQGRALERHRSNINTRAHTEDTRTPGRFADANRRASDA